MSALKNAKANYVIVGTFVIACVAGLIVAVAMLTGRTGAVDTYYTVYNSVQGLKFGTQVVYEGYPVGQVEEIKPIKQDGRMRFEVEMSIAEGWDIPDDSYAAVSSAGLLSALTINIRPGQSKTPLKPGERMIGVENADLFAAMSSLAEQISALMETDVKPLLLNLNTAVNTAAILLQEDGTAMADQLKGVLDQVASVTPEITRDLGVFSKALNSSGNELEKILSPVNRQKINASLEKMNKMVTDVDGLVSNGKPEMEKAITDMRFVMETLARHIDTISQNLDGTSRNMYEFSRHIRQNPGLLLGGTPPQDTAQ